MLRTVVIRNELLKGTLKKAVRLNVARAISVECTRRRHKNNQPSFLKPAQKLQWKPNLLRFYSALPPHLKITLPALSPTMESGTIISWEKKEGDKLNEGDLLAEIETDKATMGFETPEEGYLAKIIIAGGTKNVPIGKLVCIIVQNEADVAAFKNFKDDGSAVVPSAPPPAAAAPPPPAAAAPSVPSATPNVEHIKVFLPALSPTMEVGTIISWEKKEGDKLKEGDLLAEIETDKASMGFETPEEGYLAKILIPGGSKNVPIGKLVCIIVPNQADVAAFKNFKDIGIAPAPSIAAASASKTPSSTPHAVPMSTPPPVSSGGRVYASPMAQRLAEKRQIRLQGKGTGLFDSITSKDLPPVGAAPKPTAGAPKAAMGAPAAVSAPASRAPSKSGVASPYTDTPITSIRRVIAQRLTQSKQLVPHYYMTDEIIVDKLMATRSRLNQILDNDGVKLSINDFIIKALSLAVLKVPCTNSSWMDNTIRQYTNVDVSVAVSTEKGLITPIVFQADLKGLATISKNVKDLANKARQSKLQPQDYQGGTITVSNLGMYAVNHFTAIINPPQSCILAVGTMQKKLIIDSQDERGFKEITYIAVTLSCDHRTVDGAEGAKMLQHFRKYLEEPESMLL